MSGRRDALSHFAVGAGAAFLIQGLGLLLTWLAQIALARMLSRTDLGIYTSVSALTMTLAVPATLGLPVAMVRLLPEYRLGRDWSHYKGVLRGSHCAVLAAGLLIAAGTALVSWLAPLSPHLGMRVREALLLGTVLIPTLALSSLGMQILRGIGHVAQATWPSMLLQPFLMLASLAVLTACGVRLDSRSRIALLAASTVLALGCQLFLVLRHLHDDIGFLPITPAYEMRRWLHLSFPLLLTAGFQMVLAQMDVLTVSALLSPREVAVYGVAARLSRFISLTQFAVYLALGPSLAEAHARGDHDMVQRAVTAATRWTFWPACGATLVLMACGHFLIALYGPGFSGAYVPLCILGLGFLVNAAAEPAMVILNLTGFHYVVTKVSGLTALVGIPLSLLLTWRFGSVGTAAASALAMGVWNVCLAIMAQRFLHVHVFALRSDRANRS